MFPDHIAMMESFWDIVVEESEAINLSLPCQQYVVVVTTYEQVLDDIQLRFLKSFGNKTNWLSLKVLVIEQGALYP